ncbi:MAG TPA: hypothetical protein VGF31_04390 [Myxococcaceae bacterium]
MKRSLVVLLLAALAAPPALAASKKAKSSSSSKSARRYGVLATGPSAAVAGKAAVSALKGVTVPDNALPDAAQKYGVALGTDPAYQALALSMKLDAVVRVTTIDKGSAQLAVVQVRDGSSGAIVDDATWKAPNAKALGQMLSKQLKPRFQRSLGATKAPKPGSLQAVPTAGGVAAVAAAPAAAAPSAAQVAPGAAPAAAGTDTPPLPTGAAPPLPTATASAAAAQSDPGVVGSSVSTQSSVRDSERPVLDIAAGAALFTRNFSYNDDLYQSLQGYSLGAAVAPAVELTWSPFFGGRGYFTGHIAMSVGLQSKDQAGNSFPTSALAWGAGLGYRFLIGEKSHVGLEARFERQGFTISGTASNPKPDIPDVGYSALAAGVDLRFSLFGPVSLLGGAAYRHLFAVGEIGSAAWFPRQSGMGVDAHLGIGVELGRSFEIRILGTLQRYGFSFNPEPGDPKVAGGATDTYLSGGMLLAWRL